MRNLVMAVIGVVWGAAIVVYGLSKGVSGGAYGGGQVVALAFGVALLAAGGWTLAKRARSS